MLQPSPAAIGIALVALVSAVQGCVPTGPSTTALEAEIHRLRAEQDRQSQQIEMLQNRIVLTEDTARQTRAALMAAPRRQTITLATEGPQDEAIRVISAGSSEDPSPGCAGSSAESNLPPVRLGVVTGHAAERPPIVVRPSDRLPVVPIPPPSGGASHAPTSPPVASITVSGSDTAVVVSPGESQVGAAAGHLALDPRALPAYNAALALARSGHCVGHGGALESFAGFLVRWPDHPHADNAMYWRGECFARSGEAQQAITEWEGLLERFPNGNKVADALYSLSTTYRRMGDAAAADRAAQRLLNEHPDSDPARRMRAERHVP